MTTAAVEQYTGEGEPPYCEMTLRATDSDKSDDPLQLPVTLIGVREQSHNTFYVERVLEKSDGVLLYKFLPSLSECQVNFLLSCIHVLVGHRCKDDSYLRLRNTPHPLTSKLKLLPERNTRSIAHIGLAEQSAAYPVRAKTVLRL